MVRTLTSPTSGGIGSAGNGLSGLFGNSGDVGGATCLNPGLGSTCGVLGRDGVPSGGVPMKLSVVIPLVESVPLTADEAGTAITLSAEELLLSLRDNNPLIRSFALVMAGLGFSGTGFRAIGFSDITVSSMALGVPTFFSAENF